MKSTFARITRIFKGFKKRCSLEEGIETFMPLRSFFITILLLKVCFLVFLLHFSQLQLAPDEAQYWTWSQHLDWGYYSKPPGIAWQIFLTTHLLGSNLLGIRAGALAIGFFLALAVYDLAKACRLPPWGCFWAGLSLALSPLGFYLSFAATTDGGSTLFLTLAILAFVKALEEQRSPPYLWIGMLLAFGALFKWTVYSLWPCLFLLAKGERKSLLGGIALSCLPLLLCLLWNYSHDFATFKHVGKTLVGGGKGGNFFSFLGAQIILLSPFGFFFLLYGGKRLRKAPPGIRFCMLFCLVMGIYLFCSLFKKMQPNWGIYVYPCAFPIIAWAASHRYSLFLKIGNALSLALVLIGVALPSLQAYNRGFGFPIPYRLNPFRQNMGWARLPELLQSVGYREDKDFLFGDKYQNASLLSFYNLGKNPAYFFNVHQIRKNQFVYWPGMEEKEKGKTGYFAVLENRSHPWYESYYVEKLSPYFEKVEFLGAYSLFEAYNHPVKYAMLFCCQNYKGTTPLETELY